MSGINLVLGKAPFNPKLFFSATHYCLGPPVKFGVSPVVGEKAQSKSLFDYYWEIPENSFEKDKFIQNLENIREWMKLFDIEYPESCCEIARWEDVLKPNTLHLRIKILSSWE